MSAESPYETTPPLDPCTPSEGSDGDSPPQAAGLYIVATPIGNLRDITLRARDVLAAADLVVCEDTRVTGKLLNACDLRRPMLSHHEHNAAARRPEILKRLAEGATVALVADAGTPLVADPGYKLVRAARAAGVPVRPVPGPSAVLAALMAAGLPSDRFFFQGFLPAKAAARRATLAELARVPATLVIYESPRRLGASLRDMAEALGGREAVVARELTKRFETFEIGELDSLAARFATPPKGEVVVLVAPPGPAPAATTAEIDGRLRHWLARLSTRDAVAAVVRETGAPRKAVYDRALALRADSSEAPPESEGGPA